MKRLIKKSNHGVRNRDEALCYINGEIIVGINHPTIIKDYLEEKTELLKNIVKKYIEFNPNLTQDEIDEYYKYIEKEKTLPKQILLESGEFTRLDDKDKYNFDKFTNELSIAFGHIINYDKKIYIEENSLQNVDLNTVTQIVKNKYPTYDIYNDDKSYFDMNNGRVYEKIARLIKQSYQDMTTSNSYFMYINGEIYFGINQIDCTKQYIQQYGGSSIPRLKQEKVISGYFIENDGFYILPDFTYNVNIEQAGDLLTQLYPGLGVYDNTSLNEEGTYDRIASLKKISENAYEWVKERAQHLMEVTEMPDSMCYGVAWKQWKKENPDWKSKEEKEKKIARLIKKAKYVHYHDCDWDNEDFLYNDEGNKLG